MYRIDFTHKILLFFMVFAFASAAVAGEPTDQMKQTIDKVISILTDPRLKNPDRAEERGRLVRLAADERFDWEEMAKRSLARHWRNLTEEEKKEFVPIYADLLERTYMKRIENYSGEKVSYKGERVEGTYSKVRVSVFTSQDVEIPVEYRLIKKGADWLIYDVSIEGISLVNNYREQFNSIILRSSYEGLVAELKKKVTKN
jgi:phospholipid transport system substrate-binding protein